jgi:nucleotide-binding universal stress UspA family protein
MYYEPLIPVSSTHSDVPGSLRDCKAAREAFSRPQSQQKWLVPVDGTPASKSAVEYVIAHADNARVQVHLLNVQQPIMTGDVSVLASAKLVSDLRRSAGEQVLHAAIALLDRHFFQHSSEVVFGAPAEAIVRSAAERGCAKIVVGSRGTGMIRNALGRSVSSRVVRLSHVPVTIVKSEQGSAGAMSSQDEITERNPPGQPVGFGV